IDGHGAGAGHATDSVLNTATADSNETPPTTSSVSTPIDYKPGVSIVKTVSSIADTNHDGITGDAGDVITYNIKVTNTGDVTLTHVVVTDPLTNGASNISPLSTLAVGAVENITTSYTIKSSDLSGTGSSIGANGSSIYVSKMAF